MESHQCHHLVPQQRSKAWGELSRDQSLSVVGPESPCLLKQCHSVLQNHCQDTETDGKVRGRTGTSRSWELFDLRKGPLYLSIAGDPGARHHPLHFEPRCPGSLFSDVAPVEPWARESPANPLCQLLRPPSMSVVRMIMMCFHNCS